MRICTWTRRTRSASRCALSAVARSSGSDRGGEGMAIRHSVQLAGLAVILGLPLPAAAAPRLILGRPEVTPKRTVAVPILLRARRVDRVAALNFTLQVK